MRVGKYIIITIRIVAVKMYRALSYTNCPCSKFIMYMNSILTIILEGLY